MPYVLMYNHDAVDIGSAKRVNSYVGNGVGKTANKHKSAALTWPPLCLQLSMMIHSSSIFLSSPSTCSTKAGKLGSNRHMRTKASRSLSSEDAWRYSPGNARGVSPKRFYWNSIAYISTTGLRKLIFEANPPNDHQTFTPCSAHMRWRRQKIKKINHNLV